MISFEKSTTILEMNMPIRISYKYFMIYRINFGKNTMMFKMYMSICIPDKYSMINRTNV